MAYSTANVVQSVWGNKRVVTLVVSADATSGAVDTGLSQIETVLYSAKSAATAAPLVKINQNSAATTLGGSLFIDNAANGDDFYVTVIGK